MIEDIKEFLAGAWRAQEKLWKVFWVLSFTGAGMIQLFFVVLIFIVALLQLPILSIILSGLMLLTYFAFGIFYLCVVWKCAPNCKWQGWRVLARFYVILVPVALVGFIIFLIIVKSGGYNFFNGSSPGLGF